MCNVDEHKLQIEYLDFNLNLAISQKRKDIILGKYFLLQRSYRYSLRKKTVLSKYSVLQINAGTFPKKTDIHLSK